MVALNFLRFWRPSSVSTTIVEVGGDEEEEESFFDLELSVSGEKQSNLVFVEKPPTTTHDVFSKRRVNPIEPLTSAPSPKPRPSISSPALTGVNGSKPEKRRSSGGRELALAGAIQKCLKRIKPRKSSDKPTSFSSTVSPAPAPSRGSGQFAIRAVCKNLGKSKSSSAAAGTESPARRDDSLIQQNDNIQSAILHCKRSFSSSRESSLLSRSSSDSIKSLTSDCSVLSRYSTERWIDSARSSSEERSSVS